MVSTSYFSILKRMGDRPPLKEYKRLGETRENENAREVPDFNPFLKGLTRLIVPGSLPWFTTFKDLVSDGVLQSYVDGLGPAARKNMLKELIKFNGNTYKSKKLGPRLINMILAESNVARGQSIFRGLAKNPALALSKKDSSLYERFMNPRSFFTGHIPKNLQEPRRLKAKILLRDSDVFLLSTIHRSWRTDVNNITYESILNNVRSSINTTPATPVEKERLFRDASVRLSTLDINKIKGPELQYFRLFGRKDSNKPTHIGVYSGMGNYLHHSMFFSGRLVLENLLQKMPNTKKVESVNTLRPFYFLLEFIRSNIKKETVSRGHLYIIPYENPYPASVLRRRAIWSLGRIPYDAFDQNCETVISWIFHNNHGDPTFCVPTRLPGQEDVEETENTDYFWDSLRLHPTKVENEEEAIQQEVANQEEIKKAIVEEAKVASEGGRRKTRKTRR